MKFKGKLCTAGQAVISFKNYKLQMYSKRVPVPRARPEDPLSGCPSADPSPKKQKTCAGPISPQGSSRSKRSRLEEQLACSAAELRYIDSQSPENQQVAIDSLVIVFVWLVHDSGD